MIKTPVSSKFKTAAWPRPGVEEYVFSVRSSGGQPLGEGIKEFDWSLEVDPRRGLVSAELFRSDADTPGQPIGLFRFAIDDQQLREFEELVIGSDLFGLHPAMSGHPGYTERVYTFVRSGRTSLQRINNSDEQTNAKVTQLRSKISSLLATSFDHPERAVRLSVEQHPGEFEVTITNIGIETVCFTDPRWLAAVGPEHQAAVMITEFPPYEPGGPPPELNWNAIPLERMSNNPKEEQLVVLASKGSWRGSVPWTKPAHGRYLAYFTWANYQGQPMVDKVYRIRGRADSPRLVIE